MYNIIRILTIVLIGLTCSPRAHAALTAVELTELVAQSDAICTGTAYDNQAFAKSGNNRIYTATSIRIETPFKGTFSDTVQVEHRGGAYGGRGEDYCGRPVFEAGQNYLLFIGRNDDGTLSCKHYLPDTDPGFAPLTAQLQADSPISNGLDVSAIEAPLISPKALSGLLPATSGVSSRFLQGDRGEPIEYMVDMDVLPAGINSSQALAAVSNAFSAWSAVTSLTFKFAGIQSFGTAAPNLNAADGRIYIQLHDSYNYINSPTTLGRGGRGWTYSLDFPDAGLGGRVGDTEFDRSSWGYLVIEHGKEDMEDLTSFTEVICHEIGHVLSLDHSSETEGEADSELNNAIMFYLAHLDGRGANLQTWDINTIATAFPTDNTPPYGYERVIRAITANTFQAPLSSGLNQVDFPDYDLQGGSFPVIDSSSSGAGTFSIKNSNTIFYKPRKLYSDNDDAGSGYYDYCVVRMSDGVNLSPPYLVRVVQLLSDSNRDRQPDTWATQHSIPSGTAQSDPDKDGYTNREEWLLGSDPRDPASNLRISISGSTLSWTSQEYNLYQIQSTTHLADGFSNDWTPIISTSSNHSTTIDADPNKFYRVQLLK